MKSALQWSTPTDHISDWSSVLAIANPSFEKILTNPELGLTLTIVPNWMAK
jgi:hypothetical protein